jgi:hypothetical protein
MSRSLKALKSPGFDYHAKRPRKGTKPQGWCATPGPYTKKLTHRSERRIKKEIIVGEYRACIE